MKFRQIAPCFFAIVIDALGFGLVYPVMVAIFAQGSTAVLPLNTTAETHHFYLALSYMLYPLCMFFGASFMGDLSDFWGRKRVLLLCMFGISASFGLMALGIVWSNLLLLLAGRALSGLMAGSQPIAQAFIADLSTSESKAKNMGLISLSYSIGVIIGPLIGGVMSDPSLFRGFSLSTPFVVAMLMALSAFFGLFFLKESYASPHQRESTLITILFRPAIILGKAFLHPTVRVLALVFLFMQMGFSLYFQFVIILMKEAYHYSHWQLGAVQGLLGIGFGLGILGISALNKKYQVRTFTIVMLALTGCGQIFAAMPLLPSFQWGLAVLIAAFDMIAFAGLLTLFSNAVDEKSQGWAMGISGSVMALAWVITGLAPNLFGILSVQALIAIGGIFLLVSSGVLFLTSKIR